MTVIPSWEQAKGNTPKEHAAELARRNAALSKAAKEAAEAALPKRIYGTLQEIGFVAEYYGKTIGPITVLAGEGAPTVTGGWAKIAKVQRYKRTSLTVPEGYDPLVITVPIKFEAIVKSKNRPDIEAQIVTLEEMAGRPKGEAFAGEPPNVTVYTTDSSGNLTNLFPRKFQEDSELLWYITNITWDPNPYRDRTGERLRQAATVELTEIFLPPLLAEAQEKLQKRIASERPPTFTITKNVDSIKKVAAALAAQFNNKALAQRYQIILSDNPKLGTDPTKPLYKPHKTVKVKIPPDFWVKKAR